MKRTFGLLTAAAALLAVLNLQGCMVFDREGRGYHRDRGDLINNDGTVRYVGWCDVHSPDSRCLPTSPGPA